jgi:putative hemolysin
MSETTGTVAVSEKFLDLDKVLAAKNPALYKILPGFLLGFLKRIIHQDTLNAVIWHNRDNYGLDFVNESLREFGANIVVKGIENINAAGRWIIAANHPLGGLDGMALMKVVGNVKRDILFPVNDLLMNIENLKELFIPINKHGSNIGNARLIEQAYSSDKGILYFPAGLCSRKQKDGICDLTWQKSFIVKARTHMRDIIPCHIDGKNSNRFYNIANLRNKLGIKSNVEMMLLVDEMYRQKNKNLTITFGKPIPFSVFSKNISDLEWAQKIKRHVYGLEQDPDKEFVF